MYICGMKKLIVIQTLLCLLLAFCQCNQQGNVKRFTFSGSTQGTYYQIIYYASDSLVTQVQIQETFNKFLQIASLWEPNSEISRVNRNENIKVGTDFQTIFFEAQEISRLTGGAFDITVGDLVNVWGFGPHQFSDSVLVKIDSLRKYVGYQNIDLIDSIVVKKYPNTKIDFNAIAKGYSVDLMAGILRRNGIDNFIVDIGGEVYASGQKPDGGKWNVGIEKPAATNLSDRKVHDVISLSNKAAATSGTYRNYFIKDSIRYSHTINPTTGRPVEHTLLSVTILADKCVTADALATAFMVMGVEKAMEFLNKYPQFDGYFIYQDENNELQIVYTDGFKNLFI